MALWVVRNLVPYASCETLVDEMNSEITFTIFGKPATAGSKTAFPIKNRATGKYIYRSDGRPVINVVDANKRSGPWKEQVAHEAGTHYGGEILVGAVELEVEFVEPRPKAHYGTGRNAGRLKDSAPLYPTKKPDALKLARAIEDALTGVIWRDDSQVIKGTQSKRYGERYETRVLVRSVEGMTIADRALEAQEVLIAA